MALAQQQSSPSWSVGPSPTTLSDIVSPDISVAVWQRDINPVIGEYFNDAFTTLGAGIRYVFSVESLTTALTDVLPDGEGKAEAIDDICLLADMMTCLFGCNEIGLRLVPLSSAMCPKLHVDQIPVRLVNTYLGEGTEWLPNEALSAHALNDTDTAVKTVVHQGFYNKNHVQQLNPFDVALLKGSVWGDDEQMSAIHRSCQVEPDTKRVLLTLDPIA